jgi:hypothetical protein
VTEEGQERGSLLEAVGVLEGGGGGGSSERLRFLLPP